MHGYVMYSIFCGGFCIEKAKKKNRNQAVWFILGLMFNIVALAVLHFLPERYDY